MRPINSGYRRPRINDSESSLVPSAPTPPNHSPHMPTSATASLVLRATESPHYSSPKLGALPYLVACPRPIQRRTKGVRQDAPKNNLSFPSLPHCQLHTSNFILLQRRVRRRGPIIERLEKRLVVALLCEAQGLYPVDKNLFHVRLSSQNLHALRDVI